MQKKLMAVAVAGALAAPGVALAQTSTVQIGGSITAFYYQHTPHNAGTAKRGDVLESSEPEIFVRGEEQLGGGLSAWFQCTSSMDGIMTGASTITNSGWCARNSGMGFKGGFGNLFWGNWDVPHKLVVNRVRGWWGGTNAFTGGVGNVLLAGSASGTQNPVTTTTAATAATVSASFATVGGVTAVGTTVIPLTAAVTAVTNNPASFFRRQASTFQYHSPTWTGFQVQGGYSAANETVAIPEATPLKPRMWSLGVHYDNGPLYLGVGYERHKDYNASTFAAYTGGSDNNWVLGAGYTFAGRFKLTGLYTRSKYETTATTDLRQRGFAFFIDWAVAGPHSVKAQFIKAGDTRGSSTRTIGALRGPAALSCASAPGSTGSCASDTGAKQYAAFYAYAFSKRTEGFIGFNKVDNDSNAIFSLGKSAPTAGATQTAIGLGMRHRF